MIVSRREERERPHLNFKRSKLEKGSSYENCTMDLRLIQLYRVSFFLKDKIYN